MSQHRCILGNWATSSMGDAKQKGSELLAGNQPSLLPWELNLCLAAAGWCQSHSQLARSKGCRLPAWGEVAQGALPSPHPMPIYSDVGRGQRGSTLLLVALLNAVYQLKDKKKICEKSCTASAVQTSGTCWDARCQPVPCSVPSCPGGVGHWLGLFLDWDHVSGCGGVLSSTK